MQRAAALLIGALAMTACTSSPPVATTPNYTTAADLATGVTKAVTDKATYRFEIAAPTSGSVTAPATGTIRLTTDAAAVDTTTKRSVRSGGTPEQLHFVATTRDTTYVELPQIFGLPKDKPWVKLDRAARDEFTNTMLGFYDVIYQQAVFTKYHLPILAAGGTITLIADQGDRHRYAVTIDYQKAYNTLKDESLRAEVKLALDQQVTTSNGEIELDKTGLPVRIRFQTQFGSAVIIDDARFSDWGTQATITTPAPAQISQRG